MDYLKALHGGIWMIDNGEIKESDIGTFARVLFEKAMQSNNPDHAVTVIIERIVEILKTAKIRIVNDYKKEDNTLVFNKYIILLRDFVSCVQNMDITLEVETISFIKSLDTEPQPEALPRELDTDEAKEYLKRLVDNGFCDNAYHWNKDKTDYQAVQAAHWISHLLWKENKWKPFEKLWSITKMAQKFNKQDEANADSLKEIDKLFPEAAPQPKKLVKLS